ncbi:MAG: phosphoribosylglycinamide formyltransferase [Candidatus Dadabacteria bacterium]|nr:MAG: phosphoribosylglycinamide formyltransferase [Candidatus Dadabacteria bacterium]
MTSVVILISGRGSNFVNLVKKAKYYTVSYVIANKASEGIKKAEELGIPSAVFPKEKFSSIKDQKRTIFEFVKSLNPNIIALAGFMQILEPYFVQEFFGSLVNIHPSLLPKYPGLNTHKRVLEAGDVWHGATVHFVDEGVDTGPIIAQKKIKVLPTDTEEKLASRVLKNVEHTLYPWVMNWLAQKKIFLKQKKVCYTEEVKEDAKKYDIILPE